MRRTFRVATAFTGAAAAIAAFAPAATASTAKQTAAATPDAVTNCTGASTSIHLYWPASAHHGPTCVGEIGTWHPDAAYIKFCAGNNSGEFWGSFTNGGFEYYGFKPGTVISWLVPFAITSIDLTGYHGGNTCPW